MTDRVTVGNLRVAQVLYDFVNDEALPGTGLDPDTFWSGVDKVVADLTPKNQDLLARRDDLQAQHRQVASPARHRAASIPRRTSSSSPRSATCCPSPATSPSPPSGVDDEITTTAGPQLVVPDAQRAVRAQRRQRALGLAVRRAVRHRRHPRGRRRREGRPATTRSAATRSSPTPVEFLDGAVPLASGSWADATGLKIDDGQLLIASGDGLSTGLAEPGAVRRLHRRARRARVVGAAASTTACTSRS